MVRRTRLLSFEEIGRLVRVMAKMGVSRVRLTGGEPTLRKGIVELVAKLAAIPGISEVAMTSNAHLLDAMAAPLAKAGLASINVSLDTLRAKSFRELTRRGDIDRVVRGIEASVAAGLRVSTNAVALQGINHDELAALCEFAWDRGITPRFIERMPMSSGGAYVPGSHFSAAQIRTALVAHYGEEPAAEGGLQNKGPAQYWRFGKASEGRRFGIISAMSEHFCSTCNRLRLSATGHLHTCLAHDDALDLKVLLRGGCDDTTVQEAVLRALSQKKPGHEFTLAGTGGPAKHMISIGG